MPGDARHRASVRRVRPARSPNQRQDSPGGNRALAGHANAPRALRRLRPPPDGLTQPQGGRRMGRQADVGLGLHERAPGAVGVRAPGMVERAPRGPHDRPGPRRTGGRSARMDARDERHGHRESLQPRRAGGPGGRQYPLPHLPGLAHNGTARRGRNSTRISPPSRIASEAQPSWWASRHSCRSISRRRPAG